jgi:hypothetical protein
MPPKKSFFTDLAAASQLKTQALVADVVGPQEAAYGH